MLSSAILLILPALSLGSGFNYNRCDSKEGPSAWGGSCQGQSVGTPVNLCGATAFTGSAPSLVATGYSTARTMTIINNGHTLQATIASSDTSPPTLNAGTLSYIVGKTTNSTAQTWKLQQIHLHWGRNGKSNEGSEHYQQGTRYSAEAHLVHFNTQYANFTAAVNSGSSNALLVVGVFLNSGSSDSSATVTAIANTATTATGTATNMNTAVTISDLFDGTGTFYGYSGSLTTPGCNEIVTWIVMTTVKTISTATLSNLWKASTEPGVANAELISKYGNFRPLQTIGSRTIYNSGGATATCTTPSQPTFTCGSNAAVAAAPSFLLHAILGMFALFAVMH